MPLSTVLKSISDALAICLRTWSSPLLYQTNIVSFSFRLVPSQINIFAKLVKYSTLCKMKPVVPNLFWLVCPFSRTVSAAAGPPCNVSDVYKLKTVSPKRDFPTCPHINSFLGPMWLNYSLLVNIKEKKTPIDFWFFFLLTSFIISKSPVIF